MTAETQRLIFGNYFTAYEPMQYSTRRPYDFKAGGKGLDLLRMQIFAERYGFSLRMDSSRCRHLPTEPDECPGEVESCRYPAGPAHCPETGGTAVTVMFRAAAPATP